MEGRQSGAEVHPDLVVKYDKTHERHYYKHARTGKIGWTAQEVLDPSTAPASGAAALTGTAADSEWQQHTDQKGRQYFFHKKTRRSSWLPPRAR